MKTQCLEVANQLPNWYQVDGSIIFHRYDQYSRSNQAAEYILGMKTRLVQPVFKNDTEDYYFFKVSPNKKWLAFIIDVNDKKNNLVSESLLILNQRGSLFKSIPVNKAHPVYWLEWINNTILQVSDDPGYFLNPFTGEKKDIYAPYPDQETVFGMGPSFTSQIYDPGLTRIIYPGVTGQPFAILRDLHSGQILQTIDQEGGTPKWSPDGEHFVVVIGRGIADDLYIFSRDGMITMETYFEQQFSTVRIPDVLSWSPDGRYVAFWLETDTDNTSPASLAVFDTQTGLVTRYCINGLTDSLEWYKHLPIGLQMVTNSYLQIITWP